MATLASQLKDHFIPHPGNDHVPHVLHHRALLGYSSAMLLLKTFAVIVSVTLPGYSVYSSAITPSNIISLTNETRSSLGLTELGIDDRLMQAAQAKANDMLTNQYFAHTSPDGVTPWYWFQTYGYTYRSAGENLAAHFTQAEDVSSAWMASPSHRENIVSDRYNEIGVGIAQGVFEGYATTFVVQMFGYEQIATAESTPPIVNDPTPTPVAITPTPQPSVAGIESNQPTTPQATTATETPLDQPLVQQPNQAPTTADSVNPSENVNALNIETDSLILTPMNDGYRVSLTMTNAAQAALSLGSAHSPLEYNQRTQRWEGTILYDPSNIPAGGAQLYTVVTSTDGQPQITELATLMPSSTPAVYAVNEATPAPKLFGVINLSNLDDNTHVVYLTIMAFIALALLIAIFVKIEIQRPHMVAHSLLVITLGLCLLLI